MLENLCISKNCCNFARKIEERIFMVTAMQQQRTHGLNPMQRHLVSMLNFNSSEEAELRLKKALEQFYLNEFENMKATMFANGELTEEKVAQGAATHFRTAY